MRRACAVGHSRRFTSSRERTIRYDNGLAADYSSFRRELEKIREHSDNFELVDLVDRLISEMERERQANRRRFDRFSENLQALDSRVLTVENSRLFRLLQNAGAFLRVWKRRTGLRAHAGSAGGERSYQAWLERETARMPSPAAIADATQRLTYKPVISVLMHVDRPERQWLEQAIASVRRQSWTDWELCISEDAARGDWLDELLRKQSESDPRIRYVQSAERMGPASSLNRAGILSSGDYLALLHQHDSLAPHALFQLAEALQEEKHDLLYADEDRLDDAGVRRDPLFKPGWSPDLLTSTMYLGSFLVVSRGAMDRLEWIRAGFDGGHLYDLALRLAERVTSVKHLPNVLVHGRRVDDAWDPHKRALEDAIARRGWQAAVTEGQTPGTFQVRRRISGTPLVSLVICSKSPRLLASCLRAIANRTAYPVREIVVVEHRLDNEASMGRLLAKSHCVRVPYSGAFDFSAMNNLGVQAASGEIIVLMNDDVEPVSADWLNELIAHAQRQETGVAGPRLLYPNGAIQHAGMVVGIMDGAGHPGRAGLESGAWPWLRYTRNVSAVTGACMAVRRSVFEELGGFDTAFPVNYNDVDFCLRARRAGYNVIYEPASVLRHHESSTRPRGTTWQERELFYERWGSIFEEGDPYYSPNLTRSREDCSLSQG
jgi:GT2 family glycosyltransferase